MIAILIVVVSAALAIGSALVIADSVVRGRNAFRQLHAQPADCGVTVPVFISFEDWAARPALPALRPRGSATARQARRPAKSLAPTLHAAA